jgi:hypothetical protein
MAIQFHPTREAAVDYLISYGFDLDASGRWVRGTSSAALRQTKRGWVIDLYRHQPY